jgi:hypothetical protein
VCDWEILKWDICEIKAESLNLLKMGFSDSGNHKFVKS